jgi:hypothetical protein
MATLRVTQASVVLSAADRTKLNRSLTELTMAESKQRARDARENFARRSRIRKLVGQALTESGVTADQKMRSSLEKEFARPDRSNVQRAAGSARGARTRSRGGQTLYGGNRRA